jgi:hypothetical protein
MRGTWQRSDVAGTRLANGSQQHASRGAVLKQMALAGSFHEFVDVAAHSS